MFVFLFEINNIEQMKEKIKLALENRINSREYVVNNFTWQKTVDKLLKFIKD